MTAVPGHFKEVRQLLARLPEARGLHHQQRSKQERNRNRNANTQTVDDLPPRQGFLFSATYEPPFWKDLFHCLAARVCSDVRNRGRHFRVLRAALPEINCNFPPFSHNLYEECV
eukprot:3603775-Rhodomonas_salina.3